MKWNPRRAIAVIAYAVLGVSIVVLFISDAQQDTFDSKRAADIAAARADTVHCVQEVLDNSLTGTSELRQASKKRADADYRIKKYVVGWRLPMSDPLVQDAWLDYHDAHRDFNRELKEWPVPDLEKECG